MCFPSNRCTAYNNEFRKWSDSGVHATISDKRRSVCNEELGIAYFEAEVLTQTDYYPFGYTMPDRQWSAGAEGYRYGFNGKESDSETGFQDYGFRIYYPAIGKFLSVDPLAPDYPWYTPYQFAGNSPVGAIDLDGLEEYVIVSHYYKNSRGKTFLYKVDWLFVEPNERVNIEPSSYLKFDDNTRINLATQRPLLKKDFFRNNERSILEDGNQVEAFNRAKNAHLKNGGVVGSWILEVNPTLSFGYDQGISKTQVQQKFDQLSPEMQEVFDNMAAVLVNNPNATLDVVGSASDIPSNVGGKEKETTVENNLVVAKKRAEAGKEFILQYIKDNYKVEIKPERINTSSAGIGNSEDKKKDQTIKFEIKQ